MIKIESKAHCCGCSACVERCPQKCIKFVEDNEWFMYPSVNQDLCIDCGLCEKVCPVINPPCKQDILNSYYAINTKDSDRLASSSGGVFISLARKIINNNGVVFGAVFNSDYSKVVHTHAVDMDGVRPMMGSKYLQSDINSTYTHCKNCLKKGQQALFTGTPCQIAGLKTFLGTDYSNLITVDFICHGVPSPGVWRKYLKENLNLSNKSETKSQQDFIRSISFRDKTQGWHNFGLSIKLDSTKSSSVNTNKNSIFTPHNENEYMRAFLNDLCLRPICHECPFKDGKSGSDITLADFWGIENLYPEIDDDKGISLVIAKTAKASEILNKAGINHSINKTEEALRFNPPYMVSAKIPPKRNLFFKLLNNGNLITIANKKCMSPSISTRIKKKISNILYKLSH